MQEISDYLKNQLNRSLISIKGEIWKDIIGYEGFYKISSLARVKRLPTVIHTRNKWSDSILLHRKARIHNYHINDRNMPRVQLSKNGINKIFSLSRIVATAFLANPKNLPIVCHKDDNPVNNNYKNLFWGTQKDNMEDKCNKGRQARGETNANAVLTKEQVIQIRDLAKTRTKADIAIEFNTTRTNICYIVSYKTWRHL